MGRKKKRCKKNRRRSLKKCIIVHHQDHQEQQSCCYIQIMARIYRKCCSILIGWIFGVISTSGALLTRIYRKCSSILIGWIFGVMALTRIYRKCCSILIGWIFGVISTSGALLLGLHSPVNHLLEVKIEVMDIALLAIGLLVIFTTIVWLIVGLEKRQPHFDLFWITSLIMPLISMLKWPPPILGDDTSFVVPAAYVTFILHQLLSIYVKYFHRKY